ncbi:variable large family protein [Borrelia venezuelensis]|uniref:variable large family protein n=1 Tax=Borrelia venezuelensis TaxID=1653839 RepID=UPI001FF6DBED|nr:variable large family protein [Borrelia venezuelensis]UPA12752.1 variable large family protein [Borrelia venezuelensis]UPA12786.1 variable large family protein [Borrelia venezuelensis]UPA12878.1 variable large family protein [Borrelia venezuelensis]
MKRITLCALLMTLFLLLSCGSGQQSVDSPNGGGAATGGNSLSSVLMDVSRSAENAFYAFLDLLSGTLGLRVTKDTNKSQVGNYFNNLGAKLGDASAELEQVAKKSETELDKGELNKIIRSAVDSAKTTLNTLKTHLDSLKDIGDAKPVGEAASNAQGTAPTDVELKKAFNSLKGIVEEAGKVGVPKPKAGNVAVKVGNADNKDGVKVLAAGANAGAAVGDKAAAIVAAVSGEEILASIVKSQESDADAALAVDATAQTSALKFARGGSDTGQLAKDVAKAAAVAGGIALRSLVKDGKLAANNNDDDKVVQAVGVSAVNKLLVSIEDIIKKAVKNVLEKAKEKIDKARSPKPAAQQ